MAALEEELRDLKIRNNELAQKVQYWKMLAGQRENEKLDLMRETNELRLRLSRLRSNGSVQASNLDAALQSAAQKALAHLVRASGEIATTMDLAKAYMREREELDNLSPRWSSIGGTPSTAKKDKVHRVPPLMIGGQSIQPVVALTMLDTSNARSTARSSNSNRNITERAVPAHMLQDVYIPLTRIDVDLHTQNMETEDANNADDSSGHIQSDDNEERMLDESQEMDEDEEFDLTRRLDEVTEDTEPENDEGTPPRVTRIENPLEGPSWLLDAGNITQPSSSISRAKFEPDSTTELENFRDSPPIADNRNNTDGTSQSVELKSGVRLSREFSPTVRRRKRTSSPPAAATPRRGSQYSPRPAPARRMSNSGRVLKVLVAKMRLDAGGEGSTPPPGAEGSPPKRAATPAALAASHAPSPNGATVAGVIVSETSESEPDSLALGEPTPLHRDRHRNRQAFDTSNNIDWTLHVEDNKINTDRQTNNRDLPEQTNSRERNRQTNRAHMETNSRDIDPVNRDPNEQTHSKVRNILTSRDHTIEQQPTDSRERTSRECNEHVNNRDRNKQANREHAMEIQQSDSREQNERTNKKQNERASKERTNSRDRNKHTNRDVNTETLSESRGRETERLNTDRSDRQRSAERSDHRHKQSNMRDRSTERHEDVRPDSRESNDSSQQDDNSRAANGYRGRAGSCDSDSGSGGEREGRTRRTRRVVTYKEKALNRKLRR